MTGGWREGKKPEYISVEKWEPRVLSDGALTHLETPVPPKRLSTDSYVTGCTININIQHSAIALNQQSQHCDAIVDRKTYEEYKTCCIFPSRQV